MIGLGVFYIYHAPTPSSPAGASTGSATAVKSQFAGEIASAFYPLTDRYVGSWLTLLMEILIVTGSFACTMSFYNTGARYLFALGPRGRAAWRARPHLQAAQPDHRVDDRHRDRRRSTAWRS